MLLPGQFFSFHGLNLTEEQSFNFSKSKMTVKCYIVTSLRRRPHMENATDSRDAVENSKVKCRHQFL